MPDPLERPCPRCRAAAGEKCRNYKGQNKFTCKQRLTAEREPVTAVPPATVPPEAPSLFDGPPEADDR